MRTIHHLACVAVLACTFPAPMLWGDWAQWRGPNRDGLCAETGLLKEWPAEGPKLLWKTTGLGRGYAGVAIAAGRIFTTGDREKSQWIIALDLKTQKELWAAKVGPGRPDGPRCTPTVDGNLVFGVGTHGDLLCADAATGKELWRVNFTNDFGGQMMTHWGYSESPLVDGNKLVCTPGAKNAALAALDKKTGKVIWKCAAPDFGAQGKDGAGYSSPVIGEGAGVRQYITLSGRGLVSAAAADGTFLWGYNRVANKTANIPTPVVNGDHVFCSSGYGTGAALLKLAASGNGGVKANEVYFLAAKEFQNHHGGMVMLGGHLYAGHGHNAGSPICIEWKTGKVAWGGEQPGPGTGSAAVLYADGRLYFRYENGVMALFEATPKACNLKGSFELASKLGKSWPHPVIDDGKLYIRDQDVLLCYDVKKR
ncbi:MAG: PQQ-like beta-propeller repeat protein [Verrucomicrobia bacterium]|nr:PQQ-like beta-propeller repeat protein [Verrucomicrobiota bacterium]